MKFAALLVFVFVAIAARSVEALEVTLKNDEIVECERAWREGDTVFVQINSDSIIEFEASEVVSPKFKTEKKGRQKINTSKKVVGKKETSLGKASKASPTKEDAVIAATMIFSQRQFMESFEEWCSSEYPASIAEIRKAREEWDKKNSALIDKAQLVIKKHLSRAERESLLNDMEAENRVLSEKASAGPQQSRMRWCKEVPVKILSMHMDPSVKDPTMVKALLQYKIPSQ